MRKPSNINKSSPNDWTRFICARKSWHVDHRGEIRATEKRVRLCYGSNHFVGSNPTLSDLDHCIPRV